MEYRADWERAALVIALIGTASILTFVLFLVADRNPLVGLLVAFSSALWLLATVIVLINGASSLRIEEEIIVQSFFGIPQRSIPLQELVKVEVRRGIFPGILTFSDGTRMHVSGIAVGRDNRLISFIRRTKSDVEILELV